MRIRAWWSLAPLLVAALGTSYAVTDHFRSPFPHSPIDGDVGTPAGVGVPTFHDLLPDIRSGTAAHLTGAHASADSGLRVRFVTTTFGQAERPLALGFPLRCARGTTRPVAGTPLHPTDPPVLRMIVTPLTPGVHRLTGFTLDWRDGLLHGSVYCQYELTLRVTPNYAARC